jgi:hypothetical protein
MKAGGSAGSGSPPLLQPSRIMTRRVEGTLIVQMINDGGIARGYADDRRQGMLGMRQVICGLRLCCASGESADDALPLSATTSVPMLCKSMHADACYRNCTGRMEMLQRGGVIFRKEGAEVGE